MSDAVEPRSPARLILPRVAAGPVWATGFLAALTWALAALVTLALPDVTHWGATQAFACVLAAGALVLLALVPSVHRLGAVGRTLKTYGPWFVAIGVWFALWELTTAKFGWLPKPFFSPPQGLFNVYLVDWRRLLVCVLYTLRLWGLGFGAGVLCGYALGLALGWSKGFAYWGMPVLKLIGPVPATAWIPCTFFFFPTTFDASVFIVALASGIPVAILTAAGVGSVNRAYYDVSRVLGASDWYLIRNVAVPASFPHVFVGLFMGLYYSFAVLVVAEMLGAKYGLGWYIQFQTSYSAYANVYAALIIMAIICSGLVRLLFVGRDRLLGWQKGIL